MQLPYLLFLLTLGQGGELNSAYSAYQDMDECQAALTIVSSVFEAQKVQTRFKGCLKTSQTFTPFVHAMPEDSPSYVTLNTVSGDRITVSYFDSQNACLKAKTSQTQWCATTRQKLVP